MASVTLSGIRKIYQDAGRTRVAVADLDLAVKDGEFVVLVGPSGCGKSTTLRMVAGLEAISAGELRIGDRVVNDVPARDRNVAMVFQNYALYPHMTVFENMAFSLKLRRVAKPEIAARVGEAARILRIEPLLEHRPRQLSGGEQQRVALGRAIVRQPAVFLFDEPLSNLDAKLRVQMRREIARLHHALGATMLYVTHDQAEAMTLGDRGGERRPRRPRRAAGPGAAHLRERRRSGAHRTRRAGGARRSRLGRAAGVRPGAAARLRPRLRRAPPHPPLPTPHSPPALDFPRHDDSDHEDPRAARGSVPRRHGAHRQRARGGGARHDDVAGPGAAARLPPAQGGAGGGAQAFRRGHPPGRIRRA